MLLESSSLQYHAGDEKIRKSDKAREILLIVAVFSKHVE